MTMLLWIVTALALLPAAMTLWNLVLFRPPPRRVPDGLAVSVIVPARDEEANIGDCLDAIRASSGCALEIIAVDDHSSDRTPLLIAERMAHDPRVRTVTPPPLPPGWAGKPHACLAGARAASHPILLFVDADVRLGPDAVARLAAGLRERRVGLVSAFPRELTASFGETLLVPLIHVLLLGYLPFFLMRRWRFAALGAGCGQIMMADAAVYASIGGHGAVRTTWHDGVTFPRAFRARGHMTDLFDASGLATCRMYAGFGATWRGFAKNAREALAQPSALPIWTVLLGGGFVAPVLVALFAPLPGAAGDDLLGALALSIASRLAIALRFRQSPASVLLTPLAMLALLALQWQALLRGPARSTNWRGRTQVT